MKVLSKYLGVFLLILLSACGSKQLSDGERMANTAMDYVEKSPMFTDEKNGPKWTYDLGVVLEGLAEVWQSSGEQKYFDFIKTWMDKYVDESGKILNYSKEKYNIDNVKNGTSLLLLYRETQDEKYLSAADTLYNQMQSHPRTRQGGFWHKQIYPYQMWLDGLYMAQPFLSEYAIVRQKPELYDDIANQFIWMEKNARDSTTGLLYHGWDESRAQRWSNEEAGTSPHFWGRGMGWYVMALVDVLDHFPADHPKHGVLVQILNRTLDAVLKYQDKSGVWYDIVDLADREGNYLEASASCMFVYALAKSSRLGYGKPEFSEAAKAGYEGIKVEFVSERDQDHIDLNDVVAVSGLGGEKNYRDGSFEYYMSEPVVTNDFKGIGAFMMAAAEIAALK